MCHDAAHPKDRAQCGRGGGNSRGGKRGRREGAGLGESGAAARCSALDALVAPVGTPQAPDDGVSCPRPAEAAPHSTEPVH